ncbi:MAG: hypothetical protein HIU81_05030 [Acidobacteria bacterium]|nr:hypothetical protein [Acidobacteriota bacterium]
MQSAPERRTVTVRRAPRIVPFLVAGAVLGVLVAAIVTLAGPGSVQFDRSTVFGFFAVIFGMLGVGVGAFAAIILDRVSVRRSQRAIVEAAPDAAPGEEADSAEQ